jgi:hypothetical protein
MKESLKDSITIKRGIINLIVALVFTIILPIIVFNFLLGLVDPLGSIFIYDLIIANGILFTIVYAMYGLFKKHTLIHFFIGIGYLILLIYFYTIGSNVFTLFLPHCSFGELCVGGELLGIKVSLTYNYLWFIIPLLILKFLNMARHKIKPIEEEEETFDLRELK